MSKPKPFKFVWESGSSAPRAAALSDSDWERHRETITGLYQSMTLSETMRQMRKRAGFSPSRKQYVLQLDKWRVHKYKRSHGPSLADENGEMASAGRENPNSQICPGSGSLHPPELLECPDTRLSKRRKTESDAGPDTESKSGLLSSPLGHVHTCSKETTERQDKPHSAPLSDFCTASEDATPLGKAGSFELAAEFLLHSQFYEDSFRIFSFLLDWRRTQPSLRCPFHTSLSRRAEIGCARSAVTRTDVDKAEQRLWTSCAWFAEQGSDGTEFLPNVRVLTSCLRWILKEYTGSPLKRPFDWIDWPRPKERGADFVDFFSALWIKLRNEDTRGTPPERSSVPREEFGISPMELLVVMATIVTEEDSTVAIRGHAEAPTDQPQRDAILKLLKLQESELSRRFLRVFANLGRLCPRRIIWESSKDLSGANFRGSVLDFAQQCFDIPIRSLTGYTMSASRFCTEVRQPSLPTSGSVQLGTPATPSTTSMLWPSSYMYSIQEVDPATSLDISSSGQKPDDDDPIALSPVPDLVSPLSINKRNAELDADADAALEAGVPLDLLFHHADDSSPAPNKPAAKSPTTPLHPLPSSKPSSTSCSLWELQFPPLNDSLQSPDLRSMAALRDLAAETVGLQSSKLSIDLPSAVLGKTSWNSVGSALQGFSGVSGHGANYQAGTIASDGASGSLARLLTRGR